MNLYVRYNIDKTCRVILQEQLDRLNFKYSITDSGCVKFKGDIPFSQYCSLRSQLDKYGIEIVDNKKALLVQKVKMLIASMLNNCNIPLVKISAFLSHELQESYRNISLIFKEVCYISIESFIIIHKIEKVKQLLVVENLSLTEISFKLNYSSVAHLSHQFKKITGLTPTTFQKLAHRKRRFKTLAAVN
ncbi:AraC family transcriptional regulator [Flavobacterium sp. NRK1]|uniref:helix-turn-helix domain-containing protein n=1 Tax=Flavobacterium sp. NRK1 TaxID=2954929 RepID=UPI0020928125|nr:AraC family transcriptional regulator [Flavobacterium sp. NRK1]MCO6149433.1 AraC family transcriptional regulator [Flavobacterium sp. NRK1]